MVVTEGHELRCRPKSVKGWSDSRRAAWIGDTVHRVDVQLAVRLLGVAPEKWESEAQAFTSNVAQASYVRVMEPGLVGRSDHTAGTEFEARYFGAFREAYLRAVFPQVADQLLVAWQPPDFSAVVEFRGSENSGAVREQE